MRTFNASKAFRYLPFMVIMGCGSPEVPPNPFDEPVELRATLEIPTEDLPGNHIAGLHARIFQPTCANSGCHDGTFEPDFRTVEGTYNTLVNHPIVKNDPDGTYQLRVKPRDVDNSILWVRLNQDIDGQSGIMPLVVEPGSDWPDLKTEHMSNIRAWIEDGAKDWFGNEPSGGNLSPSMTGMIVTLPGNPSPLPRTTQGAVAIPAQTTTVSIWLALSDAESSTSELQHVSLRASTSRSTLEQQTAQTLTTTSSMAGIDAFGSQTTYFHSLNLDVSPYSSGDQVFIQVSVMDPISGLTFQLPSGGSPLYMHTYFSILLE
ncbi:hypothetical protein [Pontibacter sp. G13]|uniref:hypothetical protein n=1 Tax=Pontibacter sp. G13 TaxID=3074898 RepID=UPI00288A2B5F|nr:hypothetical protein [Pontibacter sp. G13]WNJ19736.1 hypothetical protein RJD25_04570 [Pontibacter sp. G13]